ncbi:MAG: hypothetical protein Q8L45_00405 [Xanthomonadaceae bacterium]|nr:hypothetical protein [Xanthomonadaceae bacterium]MDP2185572.1 hypothetical protein [Xanthomonadales bacterium]MDZ4114626.1 hypothetical protein [Xanthomonadaceae bacterium]
MSSGFSFGGAKQIEGRREEAEFFIKAVIDPDEYPYFVSDEASIYDISSLSSEDLRLRVERAYGVRITEEDLAIPVWQLLDRLRGGGNQDE